MADSKLDPKKNPQPPNGDRDNPGLPSGPIGDPLPSNPPLPMPGVGGIGVPAPPPVAGTQYPELWALLNRYGLMDLYDTAVEWMVSGIGDSPERLELALRATPQFQARFKGLFAREAAGLPPISVDEYLQYEDQAFQMMREFGYPPGFYDDPDDFADLIGHNVSINELQQRLAGYADAAAVGRDRVRQQLAQHMGVEGVDDLTDGELAAWFADPQRGLQIIRQRLGAAQVSAAANDSGFGSLSYDEASMLGGRGVTEDQARQAFAALAQQGDVTRALAGETEGVDRQTQLGAVAGDAESLTALERARRRRVGAFSGGGTFATGREGVGGVGTAR